jgi:hypothetical protein
LSSAVWWHGFCRSCEAHNKRSLGTGAQPDTALIRQARLAESSTVACMAIELVVALTAGIAARSVALTSFGVDSGMSDMFPPSSITRMPE